MLIKLITNYLIWLGISLVVCSIGYLSSLLYSKELAKEFLVSYIWYFNGLLIPTTGYGALFFALRTYKNSYHTLLSNIFKMSKDVEIEILKSYEKLTNFSNKQKISIPVFIVGSFILFSCGYPLKGFPKFLLWISSSSMYFAGGLMIAYLYYSIELFKKIEEKFDAIGLQENTHILELENFNLYLSLLFLVGMIALYFGFRGTLTANFTFDPPDFIKSLFNTISYSPSNYINANKLLLFPLILFLPYSLFAGFYMRYVLRKIYLNSLKKKLDEIDLLTEPFTRQKINLESEEEITKIIKIRTSVIDLKDKIIQNNKVLPIINIKDSPSIVLLIIIIVQIVYQYDNIIKSFINSFLTSD